ncbi:succinyldiaminopimelate transaminase [Stackebrandtia nassauensis]|uniref:Aminotransferase n=1 Tax=Stackebrandtia nassauensis (strain DSM 44728 / CIP 108903 / NRRL B-16338 / NBRC 102104 / LLR-40K-21) TaxID=446470 RepID=D3PW12_STANL|nr:succinyldiaminopimelate transaminase [Stackebrandtia nassauensis]ADD45133.1 aminotransferase class I and II [Stackebrandtia nassauensis DSM 44728]
MKSLPPFPWDRLAPFADKARAHPGGAVNLSMGTPVDPVPELIRDALTGAADTPGYPLTAGTEALRGAIGDWVREHCGARAEFRVLPTIGSKELVAGLPGLLGLGGGSTVAIPKLAYPTYEIGARLAGARCVRVDEPGFGAETRLRLLWVNYPSNPTGEVLSAARLRKIVGWARSRGITVVSDECYLTLGWDKQPVSILHPDVCGDDTSNLLAVHSLSKRSNLAGYRAGFVAGDPELVDGLLQLRKHAGMIVPAPVQAAMTAALTDETHATEQRERYRRRRESLREAFTAAGFRIDHSHAGLYLWATRGEDCWETVAALAKLGIVVAPGEFYGPSGGEHVRIALTASDAGVEAACARLAELT